MAQPEQQQRPSFTQPEVKEFRKWFPNLARGYSRTLPRRIMRAEGNGPLYRDMWNYSIYEGTLRRRAGEFHPQHDTAGGELPMVIDHNGNHDNYAFNGQTPIFIKDTMQTIVMVTDREIWLYNQVQTSVSPSPNRWVNCTPEYSTGTVAVTNGSAVVTGAGVDWEHATNNLLHRTQPGHLFQTDTGSQPAPAIIKSLDSDTQLTLETNWTGPTGAARNYTIRRTFFPGRGFQFDVDDIHVREHNGDLYIAGKHLGSNVSAVIKIVDFEDTGVVQADISYVCQSDLAIPGVTVPQNTGMNTIVGMELLDDGRIVLAVHQRNNTQGAYFTNRILFSSHTDHTVWNTAPGGFLDIVSIPGELTAMGKWGSSLTIHTPEKIAFAHLTGDNDAPLEIEAAALSHVGCAAPRTLKTVPGGEMFLSHDWQVYLFDGSRCLAVGDDILPDLRNIRGESRRSRPLQCFARVDRHRGEYQLFAPMNFDPGDTDRYTEIFTLHLGSGEWTREAVRGMLTAASDTAKTSYGIFFNGLGHGARCWTGRPSFDPDESGSGFQRDMLYHRIDPDGTRVNGVTYATEDSDEADQRWVVFDEQDFDFPGIDKTISRIQLWVEIFKWASNSDDDSLTIDLSDDGGTTWGQSVTVDLDGVLNIDTAPTAILDFIFSGTPQSAEAYTIRIKGPTEFGGGEGDYSILHMMVHGQVLYPVEAS